MFYWNLLEKPPVHEEHFMSQENIDIIAEYQDPVQLRIRSNSLLSINTFTSTGRTECGYTGNDNDVDKMIDEERSETGRVSDPLAQISFVFCFALNLLLQELTIHEINANFHTSR